MKDLIYNQTKIPKDQWRYGFRTSAATGCGWIATYNALCLMGYRPNPQKLIRYFQRQLPLINGNMGTFLLGPAVFFKRKGFPVKITARRKRFDDIVKSSDVSVLFFFWRRKFRFGAHFVTVRWEETEFVGYNTFNNSTGPDSYGSSLDGFLKQRKYFGAVVTAVCDRRKTGRKIP